MEAEALTDPRLAQRAAGLIRSRGWCRYAAEDHTGALCAAGALNVAAGLSPHGEGLGITSEDLRVLCETRRAFDGETGFGITYFNDRKAEVAADVLAVLDRIGARDG